MIQFPEKHFDKFYWITCSIVLAIVVLRCMFVPFAHDEVATFYFYIQPGDFLPFLSHADANGHFLMSALSWISFKFFGSSTLSLRLPCIAGFIVLCYGIFKVNKLFAGIFPKVIFSSAFILSYNFINFYSLCRGYGLSMAFLILALYYFFIYIKFGAFSHFYKFILFSQLALSANLTLVFVLGLTTVIVIVIQLKKKTFFELKNSFVLIIHFLLLLFWIKYAFFLQESGALYYGSGESYWKVTFETLIETIFFKNSVINAIVVLLFLMMLMYYCFRFIKEKLNFFLYNNFAISFFVLTSLIMAFYLLKKLFHVNYPEDRTGLFFYVFFILALSFMVNELKVRTQVVFLVVPLFFLTHFILNVNIKVHAWRVYETMPEEFYNILTQEQKKKNYPVTIAGHRVREFFYGFLNYNSPTKLNHCTAPEALQMNCDYAIAYRDDKPYYDNYYTELAQDNYWNFVLLKRKILLERKVLYSNDVVQEFSDNQDYHNAYERLDTTFNSIDPLLAEFNISVEKAPVPFNAWLVMEINSATNPDSNITIRTPLNLVKYDWNGTKNLTTSLVSPNIPFKIKRIVAYLWNIDKQEIKIKLNSFRLYQLRGEGVRVISPAKI